MGPGTADAPSISVGQFVVYLLHVRFVRYRCTL
jgi:hypothetical protein